jgi:hypothetical protein
VTLLHLEQGRVVDKETFRPDLVRDRLILLARSLK